MDVCFEEISNSMIVKSLVSRKKISELSVDLIFLINNLKPCILWDYNQADPNELLKLNELFGKDLIILVIGLDCVITFAERLKNSLNNFLASTPNFIDASAALNSPQVVSYSKVKHVKEMVQSVLAQLDIKEHASILEVSLSENWNLSTLFGILLGFPVIYYYDNFGDNCLSNINLNVWKVGCKWTSIMVWPISFSVPCDVEELFKTEIENWWNRVGCLNKWGHPFQLGGLQIISASEIVNMSSVVL